MKLSRTGSGNRIGSKLAIIAVLFCVSFGYSQIGEVIWEENFNNLDNWNILTGNGSWGWGNGELEYYHSDNVEIADVPGEAGNKALHITAKQESGSGIADQWGNPLNYTSGKVTTKVKVAVKYGMIEARVRVPNLDVGGWPAVWLLGTSNFSWPYCGEMDMMEMGHTQAFRDLHDGHNGGNGLDNSTVNQVVGANAIFYADEALTPENPTGAASISWDPDDDYCRPYYNHDLPLNDRFIIYRVYWDDSSLRFTVIDDGTECDLYTDIFPIDSVSMEFQQPFYLIANLAIGGAFTDAYNLGDPGSGLAVSMPFPAHMYVDYIKVMKWNGQGEVRLGPPYPEGGTFGIFTDSTATDGRLVAGVNSEIYVWEKTLTGGSIAPFEGDNVLSWKTTGKGWFGAGIMSAQPLNMSNFGEGHVNFRIKIPADVTFEIGISDTWGNQYYVEFPAGQTKYGLTRDGSWGLASIPVSEIRGEAIDLRMLAYSFIILEGSGASCEFALDDIYWDGGGIPNIPIASAGPDQIVLDADGSGSESVTLNGSGSMDRDGTIDLYSWTEGAVEIATGETPAVDLALGIHEITLTVTDNDGKTDSDQVSVTVLDNYPPQADAGNDTTVVDSDGDYKVSLTLDGSGSFDSDGTITSYSWSENGSEIATGPNPAITLDIGKHTITLTVTDDDGDSNSDDVVITVNNRLSVTAPAIVITHTPISVDENIESVWYKTPEMEINNVTVGTMTQDFHAQWKAMYDDTNLYLLVEIIDETQFNDSGNQWYNDDCIEVFIDGDNSKNSNYDGKNDFQFGFRWDDETIRLGNNSLNRTTGIEFIVYKTAVGQNLEASIPWTTIGVSPNTINTIGFDVAVDDDDNGGPRECAVASMFTADNAWHNPSVFGSVDLIKTTALNDDDLSSSLQPSEFRLGNNYPNPFNPETTISYSLPKAMNVNLTVYDVSGQIVATLVNKHQNRGGHTVVWNASNESSGVYFYKITADKYSVVKKCMLLK